MTFRNALLIVLIIEVGVALLAVINFGTSLEALQAVTRFSGRASLAIFSFIFLFHNHRQINLNKILSDKYFLVFAIAHAIHLGELLAYVFLSGNQVVPTRAAGGFLAYVYIFLMPYLQYKVDTNRLSEKKFKTITLVYLYYVWSVFFLTYLPRVRGEIQNAGGSYTEFVILLAWVSTMMGFKFSAMLKPRSRTRID
ncbi:MAG TPA: hypothetical protein PLM56_14160 [Cyclobacteriaceae bacterium]|jgi:hypothetical protein|nr:hypothetical protein [Cytophagales bacterium]HNT51003.1 hypothetical protein [Cyclobacteriaceae bacterium]HRE68057.1 hypothetical protein [Cyclobacteriaceae bacterium]HRF34646.1 hypothetical protein [Cyclobacteriaceae bacterium]